MPMMHAVSANITPAGAIGAWSDAELARAIREGIRPDGSLIGPPMPFSLYKDLSDTDLAAIVAFLRTLKPIENATAKSVYNFPLPPAYGPPSSMWRTSRAGRPPSTASTWPGRSPTAWSAIRPIGPQGPMYDTASGRAASSSQGPGACRSPPTLPRARTASKHYTDADIAAMITEGVRPDGTKMLPPMPYAWLAKMTPDDLEAVIVYLRTLPPLPDTS